jgi:hypothetical protein
MATKFLDIMNKPLAIDFPDRHGAYSSSCAAQPTIMACDLTISNLVPSIDNEWIFLLFMIRPHKKNW